MGLWGGGGGAVGWKGGRGRGVHPLASKGVWGSAVSSPIGAWGGAPEAFTFFASNHAKKSAYLLRIEFLKRIYIRAKDNEVYCDNAFRNGRQQAPEILDMLA